MKKQIILILALFIGFQTQIFAQLPEEGMSSPMHTKYVDKIVWANKRISKTAASEADFKTTFTQDDNIYGRIYLSKAIANYPMYRFKATTKGTDTKVNDNPVVNKDLRGSMKLTYVFYVDGATTPWYKYTAEVDALNPATGTCQILFKKDKADEAGPTPDALTSAMNDLAMGTHKVKVDVWGGSYWITGDLERTLNPLVSGEFTLNITKKASYGKTFDGIPAGKKEPTIEPKMLQLANLEAPKDASWDCKKFTKIKIIDADWEYVKHSLTGAILSRSINAALFGVLPSGTCSYTEVNYEQTFISAGKYTEPKIVAQSSAYKVDCN
ncbi:MAG: hypothetical protein V4506_02260 [Bacteroidota bacterium]